MSTEQETQCEGQRLTGLVKWFNNKSGFGFLTVCGEGEYSNKDIFVHFSSIRVTNSQYKYLVQGEYVEFVLIRSENEKHEFHATDVTGIMGGAIMCETRRLAMVASSSSSSSQPAYRSRPTMDEVINETGSPTPRGSRQDDGYTPVQRNGRTSRPRTTGPRKTKAPVAAAPSAEV